MLINIKMPIIVGILTFMSMINSILGVATEDSALLMLIKFYNPGANPRANPGPTPGPTPEELDNFEFTALQTIITHFPSSHV